MAIISVFVSSPDTHSERRIDPDLSVSQLKDKLVPITGISPQYQVISLFKSTDAVATGKPFVKLEGDESKSLKSFGIEEWNCIKVDNTDPNYRPGEFTDETNLERFELTNEEYEKRQDTVLSHLKANKLGRFADVPTNLTYPHPSALEEIDPSIRVGARCEVSHGGLGKRGTVRFVGVASGIGKGGVWIGVELDEPLGKSDGEVEGKRYFQCSPRHATFVRPDKVTIGDFPEEDLFASDEDEI
ncbi:tubulin-folding cofactor B [Kwoniella heveanensis BCC8398]|uniref:Tubulin-folding cofactor B n=1 Tax=Kwoniella heveanensis BCC8398 TaxID=1296120 RepID=A0A1B9GWU6_9TREE|nr:tubulin-folding cofactor B [Kwoniella heveanensis BCC8398]